MIFKSNGPLSPDIQMNVFGVPFDYISVQQLILDLSEDNHDMLTMVATGLPPSAVLSFVNAPVSVEWRHGSTTGHSFRGYVTHVKPSFEGTAGLVNSSPFQTVEIVCLGASFTMKGKKNRLWENVSLSGIVSSICLDHRFSHEVPRDTFRFFRVVQSGESDWEFLKRLCHDLGYSMTLHGTHLHIFDRLTAVGRNISRHRLRVPGKTTAAVDQGQILKMDATVGYLTPEGNSNTDKISVLDNRGAVSTITRKPPTSGTGVRLESLFTDEVSGTSLSVDYARKTLAARARNKFPFHARLELTGTSGILPGGFVEISEFSAEFDGLWYVTDIRHTLTRDKYYTELSVIKDTTKGVGTPTNFVPAITRPASVLNANVWRSSRIAGTEYA